MQGIDQTDRESGSNESFLINHCEPLAPANVDAILLRAARRVLRPRLLIDTKCRILWASPRAEEIMQSPLPLTITDRHLCVTSGGEQARAWTAFVEGIGDQESRLFIQGQFRGTWVLVRAWEERLAGNRAIFVECKPSSPLQDVASSGLVADFGLTRSETSVLNLFAKMMKPDEIADTLGVSLSTVRSHLKQIHTKMAVNSSTHLLRITRAYCDR